MMTWRATVGNTLDALMRDNSISATDDVSEWETVDGDHDREDSDSVSMLPHIAARRSSQVSGCNDPSF
jgi:hypothetical protein